MDTQRKLTESDGMDCLERQVVGIRKEEEEEYVVEGINNNKKIKVIPKDSIVQEVF